MTSGAPSVLPREITSEKTREGIRYKLPPRDVGRVRFLGLIPLGFGLLFMAIPINMMSGAFRDVLTKPSLFHALLGLFLLVFVYAALKPIKFGMLALCGRCTVCVTPESLRVVDSAGPFRHVRKARIDDVRRFEVETGRTSAMPAFFKPLEHLAVLEAHFDWSKEMPLAIGYPREWLVALGNELTTRLSELNLVQAKPALPAATEVVKDLSGPRRAALFTEDVPVQPKVSTARVETAGDTVTIVLPPRGIRRGSKGLLTFGVIWCVFMAFFSAAFLFAKSGGSNFGFGLFILVFWCIGLAMILGAINSGRRRGLLIASPRELRIAQESLLGKKIQSWTSAEVAAIRADHSGLEVNSRPVINLQVHAMDGRSTGFFNGRDELELQWLATVLRQTLQVPAVVPGQAENPSLDFQPSSR